MLSMTSKFVCAATCAAAIVLLARVSAFAQNSPEDSLVIQTTGGAFEKALDDNFYSRFSKETGANIVKVSATYDEMRAKLKAMTDIGTPEWDIVSTDPQLTGYAQYLETLDCKRIPNAAQQGVQGTCQPHGLLRGLGGGVMAYDTDLFGKNPPKSWADFWDVEKFPGPRALTLGDTCHWALTVALYADGVSKVDIETKPLDLDRGYAKLDKIRPNISVFWNTGDQSQQLWRSKEVVMAMMYSGRAVSLKKEGLPVEVVWKGAPRDVGYWSIVKGAKHPNAAYAFLDFFMSNPDAHVAFAEQTNYDTSNAEALALLPEKERPFRAGYPENWSEMIHIEGNPWIIENHDLMVTRCQEWLAQ